MDKTILGFIPELGDNNLLAKKIYTVALITGDSVDEILSTLAGKVKFTAPPKRNNVENHGVVSNNGVFYVQDDISLAKAYAIIKYNDCPPLAGAYIHTIAKRCAVLQDARSDAELIQKRQDEIIAKYRRYLAYQVNNIHPFKQIEKMASKVGWKLLPSEGMYPFVFYIPKLKFGNDIEGYITYTKCTLKMDKNLRSSKLSGKIGRYKMSNLMHPHIAAYVCYGNMEKEVEEAIALWRYDIAFSHLYDAATNYTPDSPFISITRLKNEYSWAKKQIKTLQYLSGEELLRHIFERGYTCRRCGSQLSDTGECRSANCQASLLYTRDCHFCRLPLSPLRWDDYTVTYLWTCDTQGCYGNLREEMERLEQMYLKLDEYIESTNLPMKVSQERGIIKIEQDGLFKLVLNGNPDISHIDTLTDSDELILSFDYYSDEAICYLHKDRENREDSELLWKIRKSGEEKLFSPDNEKTQEALEITAPLRQIVKKIMELI